MQRDLPRRPEVPVLTQKAIDLLTKLAFRNDDPIEKVDLIFFFGTVRGISEAVAILKNLLDQKITHKVMVTGGMPAFDDSYKGYTEPESETFLKAFPVGDYPDVVFYKETVSTDTRTNVTEALKVHDFSQYKKILFIAKRVQGTRAYLTMKRYVPNTKILQATYSIPDEEEDVLTPDNWYETLLGRQRVFSGFQRIALYGRRGDIEFEEVRELVEEIEKELSH